MIEYQVRFIVRNLIRKGVERITTDDISDELLMLGYRTQSVSMINEVRKYLLEKEYTIQWMEDK